MVSRVFTGFLCLSLFGSFSLEAQQTNNCGLIAKMLPGGDSVLQAPANISFQNASINATDYQFIIDGFRFGLNNPVTIGISPGLTTVQLVAYNGSCTDTTVSYYFFAGQFPVDTDNVKRSYGYGGRGHVIKGIRTLADGGNILFGHRTLSDYYHESQIGLLIKTKQSGCVEWARNIPVPLYWNSSLIDAKEATGGDIYTIINILGIYNYLFKIGPSGNKIWSLAFENGTPYYDQILGIEPAPDGGVIVITSQSLTSVKIIRLNSGGQIIWQKLYDLNTLSPGNFKSTVIKDGYLYIAGGVGYNNNANYGAFICKIDMADGRTVWTKDYKIGPDPIETGELVSVDSTIVMSILGTTGDPLKSPLGGLMRIDTSGSVKASVMITENYVPNPLSGAFIPAGTHLAHAGSEFYILTSGGYPLYLQGDGTNTKQIRLDSMFRVKWVKSNGGVGQPRYYFNAPGPHDGVIAAGIEYSPALSPLSYGFLLSVAPIDSSGGNPNAACYFMDQGYEVRNPQVSVTPVQWTTDAPATNTVVPADPTWQVFYPEMRYKCPDYIDSCSYLKLSGPVNICNLTKDYIFKSHKNKACGQPTNWSLPSNLQVLSQTDTSVIVRFPAFGRYVIYGRNSLGCVPVEDSLVIIAESKTPPVSLGADIQLCPGNTKILHAGNVYTHYEWQDGSTDSLLTINRPGQYWVKVTDSCENILSDTINVIAAPPVPISIGPDRIICANDTIHLTATAGFLNYQWSPAYRISSTTGQSITASPLVDTVYTVTAEKTPGCFAFDTMRVEVFPVPPIDLGIDKRLCRGDSLILDAGTGFVSYAWNTGSSSQTIIAKNLGKYSVIGTTTDGCRSYDTLTIIGIYERPAPRLDQNNVLCEGIPRQLSAGNGFVQYNWSTGATTAAITVSVPGIYVLVVTDAQGCTGSDTARITVLRPAPSSFLPADLLICSYETPTLTPLSTFINYTWSTGSTAPGIKVTSPGNYWLQVSDQYGCTGRDSITIGIKTDCITGVFVPTAFTPNGDGRNELFKPIIYGNVQQYMFRVFDRWGNIVFESAKPGQGWDGSAKGVSRDANVYVWTLLYQLDGQPVKQQKGTVVLMR